MHKIRLAMTGFALIAALLSGTCLGATTYSGSLNGPAESPPVASPGTGTATVIYDSTLHTLNIAVNFSGLLGTTTASHIHCCTAIPNSGTVGIATTVPTFAGFPLGVTSGTYNNTLDLTQASSWNAAFIAANGGTPASAEAVLAAGLANEQAYLNIHTNLFPAGEIRSFLTLVPPQPVPTLTPLASGMLMTLIALASALALRRRHRHG